MATFIVEDIYKRVKQGEDLEAIAQEMTNALNEVLRRVELEEEEARIKAQAERNRIAAAEQIIVALKNYMATVHKDKHFEYEFGGAQSLADVIDKIAADPLNTEIELAAVKRVKANTRDVGATTDAYAETMGAFFSKFGI